MKKEIDEVFQKMHYWKKRHIEALQNPTPYEKGFLDIIASVENFVKQWEVKHNQKAREDYFLAECIGQILSGYEGLLNFDLESFDGGLMSKKVQELKEKYDIKD